jgi:hypothetical protein
VILSSQGFFSHTNHNTILKNPIKTASNLPYVLHSIAEVHSSFSVFIFLPSNSYFEQLKFGLIELFHKFTQNLLFIITIRLIRKCDSSNLAFGGELLSYLMYFVSVLLIFIQKI